VPTEAELRDQLKRYSDVLNHRAREASALEDYREGRFPLPPLVQDTGLTNAYRSLMQLSGSNWPGLIVSAVEERTEIQGIRFGDSQQSDDDVWAILQENGIDAESSALHDSVFTTGRGYALVWGDGSRDPKPKITLEHASLCVVEYEPGSRRQRRGALRRWRDGKRWCANLYRPEALYKFFVEADELPQEATDWKRREDDADGLGWEIPNEFGEVPVVEFAVNRSLRPAPFGSGVGEFATNLRHIDRINYKVFSGLVALTWSGFPLRYVIGDPILYEKDSDGKDDKTKPVPPFKSLASSVAQFANPDAKVGQLPEATIDNYSPEMDIKHLAALTKTPAHYLLGEMVNLSADAIRAAEAGLISKVRRHHRSLGESWEDVARLALKVKDPTDARVDQEAEIIWRDPESRSLAERADAATKLASIDMPWQVIASKVMGMTPQEIRRATAERGSDVLSSLMADTNGLGAG
jgi:hypothetical protein